MEDFDFDNIVTQWFIDNEGPVSDMEKVLDALFEGKNVQMRYRDN